jgi:NADP-dependent 3-hydroxy acid dehydrogenase YdfG
VERLHRRWEAIDILVHCAGVYAMGKIETASVMDIDLQYRTNVRAPCYPLP